MFAFATLAATLAGCQPAVDPGAIDPDADLPDPDDGKADVSGIIDGLRDRLNDLIQNFSATTGARYYQSADEAIAAVEATVRKSGLGPDDVIYVAYVGKFKIPVANWDHSEFRIRAAIGLDDGRVIPIDKRTVGDPNGAGLFDDQFLTAQVGPRLCLSWTMLKDAIRASYLRGVYALSFVCHTDTASVLEAIGVAPEYYQPQIGGWLLTRWLFGPLFGSGLSRTPADWAPVQNCSDLSDIVDAAHVN